jgi:heat shock protein beta
MVLQDLVKKYSEFINFPIYLWATKEVDVEVPADEDESSESSEEEESCKFSVYVFISFR